MAVANCRYFSGYKPCGKNAECSSQCPKQNLIQQRILIVHLGALGAVVRSTSLLASIKRKYPNSHLTWVTDAPAHKLIENHPSLDRVLTTSHDDMLQLRAMNFDVAFVIDKSLKAAGVLANTTAREVFGFKADPATNTIAPATTEAEYLWSLGLSNAKKFFENQKPETELMIEALALGKYLRDDYDLPLTEAEIRESSLRQKAWRKRDQIVIGLNTGCSSVIPFKKWTVEYHRELILDLLECGYKNIVLLGGPEDTERNERIGYNLPVIQSATASGLRDGLVSMNACDLVVSGDSLGLHMAIALKKYTVAWFGPTCAHEIDLFERGVKLQAEVSCSPCWKRICDQKSMCYDQVPRTAVLAAVQAGERWIQNSPRSSLSKPPSLEISV